MSKYIFATKFKKIEKEPLYYNIQLTVDKDVIVETGPTFDGATYYTFYADSPIILKDSSSNKSQYQFYSEDKICEILTMSGKTKLKMASQVSIMVICEGSYPFPEIISVVYNDTTFTFTPIPVYE